MRIQRTEIEWKRIIEEQKASGQSIIDYCRERGINPNVFYRQNKKFQSQGFVRIDALQEGTSCRATIKIGKIIIEAHESIDPTFLTRVIHSSLEACDADIS